MAARTHLFFDLDHTLWDYETNARITLEALFARYRIGEKSEAKPADLVETFRQVNSELWADFNTGAKTKDDLRQVRFPEIYRRLGLDPADTPEGIEEEYMDECSAQGHLLPHAKETLDYLKEKDYPLHIITNSFDRVAYRKMETSGIVGYFDVIVTSETTPYKKPERGIFDFALEQAATASSGSLMIGDNPETDLLGAQTVGMPSVYYNYHDVATDIPYQAEIRSLDELRHLL